MSVCSCSGNAGRELGGMRGRRQLVWWGGNKRWRESFVAGSAAVGCTIGRESLLGGSALLAGGSPEGGKKSGNVESSGAAGAREALISPPPGFVSSVCRLRRSYWLVSGPFAALLMREIFFSRRWFVLFFSASCRKASGKGPKARPTTEGLLAGLLETRLGDVVTPTPLRPCRQGKQRARVAGSRAVIGSLAGADWAAGCWRRQFWNQRSSAGSPEAPRGPAAATPAACV